MADLVKQTMASIDARIAELAPLVEEHSRLKEAAEAIRAATGPQQNTGRHRRSAGRRTLARTGRAGTWKQSFLAEVAKSPGATTAELAKRLDVDPRRVSTLGSQLKKSGEVKKNGRGFYPISR